MLQTSNNFLLIVTLLIVQACSALPRLEIGSTTAEQLVVRTKVAPGLTLFQVKIESNTDEYMLASKLLSEIEAKLLVNKITSATQSLMPNFFLSYMDIELHDPSEFGNWNTELGKRLFIGKFESKVDANSVKDQLLRHGIHLKTISAASRAYTEGNFEISVLKVEPTVYSGTVRSILADNFIQGSAAVSEIAQQVDALAAINGGFFAYQEEQGVPGDPAGISVLNGNLVSEAIFSRPALMISNMPELSFKILNNVSTKLRIRIGNKWLRLDGVNRKIKYINNCGYIDDGNYIQANHDVVCINPDEIIIYDNNFGDVSSVLQEDNFFFWVDEKRHVYFRSSVISNAVPNGHYLVAASGKKKTILKSLAKSGLATEIEKLVYSEDERVVLRPGVHIINGGPNLLLNDRTQNSNWEEQGWSPLAQKVGTETVDPRDEISDSNYAQIDRREFYDSWINARHPRTAAGVTRDGNLYLVVVYGRNPYRSIGASVPEMANIMRSLGATDALNLDGGGSSVMVVNGQLTGAPSDKRGERKIADTLVFTLDEEE